MDGISKDKYNAVIYGGGVQAVCAAAKTIGAYKGKTGGTSGLSVLMIVPEEDLGGICTVGRQNFWDYGQFDSDTINKRDSRNHIKNSQFTIMQKGTFSYMFNNTDSPDNKYERGAFYNTEKMAEFLLEDCLGKYMYGGDECLDIAFSTDITGAETNGSKITSVSTCQLQRILTMDKYTNNELMYVVDWIDDDSDDFKKDVKADIFIDASEDGRLARMAGIITTTGRYDWSINGDSSITIPSRKSYVGRQQASTLMFKIKNIDIDNWEKPVSEGGNRNENVSTDHGYRPYDYAKYKPSGIDSKGLTPGNMEMVTPFNDRYGKTDNGETNPYILKGSNIAQNGSDPEYWVNAFLIFNVDARLHYRDQKRAGSYSADLDIIDGYVSTDVAWNKARYFLTKQYAEYQQNSGDNENFWNAFRSYGKENDCTPENRLANAEPVLDDDGYVEVADILYIRESVHTPKNVENITNTQDDDSVVYTADGITFKQKIKENNYAIVPLKSIHPEAFQYYDSEDENTKKYDDWHYQDRIGFAMYNADIHPYEVSDLKTNDGTYIWGPTSFSKMRPDLGIKIESDPKEYPKFPVYIPYSTIITNQCPNLLLPGYAASISSASWGELRIFPHLCVLGDAAGAAAGYCIATPGKEPSNLDIGFSEELQSHEDGFVSEYLRDTADALLNLNIVFSDTKTHRTWFRVNKDDIKDEEEK